MNFRRIIYYFYPSLCTFCFQNELFIDHTKNFWEFGLKNRDSNQSIDYVVSLLEEMNLNPVEKVNELSGQEPIFYDIMYKSPWANHLEVEMEHKKIFTSIHDWFDVARNGSNENGSVLMMLMISILLLNLDGFDGKLVNKKSIEESQQRYATLLHSYLKTEFPEQYQGLLAKGLMFVQNTQRAHELSLQKLQLF